MAFPGLLCLGGKTASVLIGRYGQGERQSGDCGLLLGSKMPKMARFSPKIGAFRGVLFTTKATVLFLTTCCKHLITNALSVSPRRGVHRKWGSLWGRGWGIIFFRPFAPAAADPSVNKYAPMVVNSMQPLKRIQSNFTEKSDRSSRRDRQGWQPCTKLTGSQQLWIRSRE